MSQPHAGRLLAVIALIGMIGAIVAGWFAIGSPAHQRELSLDQRRVVDLHYLATTISEYWNVHKSLPPNLDKIDRSPEQRKFHMDPETGQPYKCFVTGTNGYRLCAKFSAATEFNDPPTFDFTPRAINIRWSHPAGRYCFDLAAK
ncbi:MAG: hypothetical protein M3R20_04250 [Pseudomonadota bacterium]|nr:hypothetical protein [Pseudomonadota bacterium]